MHPRSAIPLELGAYVQLGLYDHLGERSKAWHGPGVIHATQQSQHRLHPQLCYQTQQRGDTVLPEIKDATAIKVQQEEPHRLGIPRAESLDLV
jgi:hypothetical protein